MFQTLTYSLPRSISQSFPEPNYVNPVKRSSLMPGIGVPLVVLSTFTIAVRIWSRFTRQTGGFGLDDVFILLAWVFAMALTIGAIAATHNYEFDRHIWDVRPELLVPGAMQSWIGELIFLITTCLCKIGILLFYRRMVAGSCSKFLLYACWAGIAFTAVYGIVFVTILCTTCKPLDAFWLSYNPQYQEPHVCDGPNPGPPVSGAMSVFSDLYAVVLPYLVVQKLRISKRQKYALYAVFGFGLIVVACGIARSVFLARLVHTLDTTWTSLDIFVASNLEAQLSIIGSCLPNLRKLFGSFFGDSPSRFYSNMRFASPKAFGSSKDPENSGGRRPPIAKQKRDISTTDEIELVSTSGSHQRTMDRKPSHGIYSHRFSSATFYEKDLPSPPQNAFPKRNLAFPHTVF